MTAVNQIKILEKEIEVQISALVNIKGTLTIPSSAEAIVLFAHGSGSSRFSTRNRYVAEILNNANIAALLIDLLIKEEEEIDLRTAEYRFDIDLLTSRVVYATNWLRKNEDTKKFNIGYFGASTGAAAALAAAAKLGSFIGAVVSRGGRTDLADTYLPQVTAPTLFIAGENDPVIIDINQRSITKLSAEKKLEIVPGASHLFEEPGALEKVAAIASEWFSRYLIGQKEL